MLAVMSLLVMLVPFSFAQEQCDYKLEILAEGLEFTKENFRWRMKATKIEGKSTSITGAAAIEHLNGSLVKNYRPWNNQSISKQKTSNEYSPNLPEGDYKITAQINVECDDTNRENNIDARTIKITQAGKEKIQKNNLNQKLGDENATKINAENNSEENRNNEPQNSIDLRGESSRITNLTAAVAEPIDGEEYAYISSNEKAKSLIIYFLLGISVALNIVLIWRR